MSEPTFALEVVPVEDFSNVRRAASDSDPNKLVS